MKQQRVKMVFFSISFLFVFILAGFHVVFMSAILAGFHVVFMSVVLAGFHVLFLSAILAGFHVSNFSWFSCWPFFGTPPG